MSYARDYETKGIPLIKLGGSIGVINATTQNFNMAAEEIAKDEGFIKRHNAQSGVLAFTIAHATHHSTNPKTYYLALKTLVDGMLDNEINSCLKP